MKSKNLTKKQKKNRIPQRLIKLVKEYPVIYELGYKCTDYNKEEQKAWAEIDAEMQLHDCRNRWLSLRSKYFAETLDHELMNLMSFLNFSFNEKERNENCNASDPEKQSGGGTTNKVVKELVLATSSLKETGHTLNKTATTASNSRSEAISSEDSHGGYFVNNQSQKRDRLESKNSNGVQTLSVVKKRKLEFITDDEDVIPPKKEKEEQFDDQSFLNFLKYIHFITRDFPPLTLNKLKLNIFQVVCATERELMKKC